MNHLMSSNNNQYFQDHKVKERVDHIMRVLYLLLCKITRHLYEMLPFDIHQLCTIFRGDWK